MINDLESMNVLQCFVADVIYILLQRVAFDDDGATMTPLKIIIDVID